jgi:hypothetical protein
VKAQSHNSIIFIPKKEYNLYLYEECKNSFWLKAPLPCDSLQLRCLLNNAKIWKEKDGSWAIVPQKNAGEVQLTGYCGDSLLTEQIKFKTFPISWEDVRISIDENWFYKVCLGDFRLLVFSGYFSIKKWKKVIKGREKKTLAIDLRVMAHQELRDAMPYDMRFKIDTCIVSLTDPKGKVKLQKIYTKGDIQFDVWEFIELMKPKDILKLHVPSVLRMNYNNEISKIQLLKDESEFWDTNADYFEKTVDYFEKIVKVVK